MGLAFLFIWGYLGVKKLGVCWSMAQLRYAIAEYTSRYHGDNVLS